MDDQGNDLMPAMLDTYNRLNLDCLIVMGGNGTQKSAKLLMDAGMNIITLPKTIDNDIWGTDTTFRLPERRGHRHQRHRLHPLHRKLPRARVPRGAHGPRTPAG